MNKILILILALSLAACKDDCNLVCTFTIENSDGVVTSGTFDKSAEIQCDLTDAQYKSDAYEFMETYYVNPYNIQAGNNDHFATLDCND